MNRALAVRLAVLALLPFSLTAAGCGGEKSAPPAASSAAGTEKPELPADVAAVAPVVEDAALSAAPGAPAGTEPSALPLDKVVASGELVSPVSSELAARFAGRVERVMVDRGDRVHRGQPVFALETQYLALDLQRAEAELARARAANDEATRDLARKQALIAKNSIAQAAFDRSQSASQSSQAAVGAAVAARDLARQRVRDAVVTAPIDGVVTERRVDPGERLGDNSVALVIVQTAPLKLRFDLPERYLSAVRMGQSLAATVDPYPGEVFTGKVTRIDRVVDPKNRTVTVETELPNRDGRLSPGLFARVEIDLTPGDGSGR